MKLKRFLRTAFWCLLIFLVFALIWWGGPELRVGESRPLEPVGWRLGLIALILLILASPLLLRALSYLYEKLKTVERDSVVDQSREACLSLRAQVKRHCGGRWSLFAPDYLLLGPADTLETLIAQWPAVVAWRVSHEGAGLAFMSEGRIYLAPAPAAWSHWARLLRWRPPPRGLVAVLPGAVCADRTRLQEAMDKLYTQGAQWRALAGRVLPLWLGVLAEAQATAGYDWHPEQSNAPWGLTLPRGRFSRNTFERLSEQTLRTFDLTLTDPNQPATQVQRWMLMQAAARQQLRNVGHILARQTDRSLETRLQVRGLHFLWPGLSQPHGLPGWITVLARDRGRAALSLEWALARAAVVTMAAVAASALVVDATWMRAERHERVLSDWSARLPKMPLLGLLAQPTAVPSSNWILALNDLDLLMTDSEQRLREEVPESARRLIDRLHTAGVHRGLITKLHLDGQAAFAAREATVDQRYRYLAFSMMLHAPARANAALMQSVLADFGMPPSQVGSLLGHWMRAPVREPTAGETAQIQMQRARLRDTDRYSHEAVLWSAMQEQLRPVGALDFSLERYMGPNAGWFMPSTEIAWFFTYEGLLRGFNGGRQRYEAWTREYRWVMGEPEAVFSLDAQEAMEVRLRTRYVQEATDAWRKWMEGLRLQPVSGLSDAADRAQLFGTEASPVVPLLNVLEVHMPLPQTGKRSFWERLKIRVAEDWARLQFALGWRRSPSVSMSRTDPRIPIGQNFALLQMYFLNGEGKSPQRDQYLSALASISDYLGKLNASDQMGSKVPAAGLLIRLRAKALRTPSPLRELMLELANSGEEQVKRAGAQSLGLMLEEVASFERCKRTQVHPMDLYAPAELAWMEFTADFGSQGRVAEITKAFASDPTFLKSMAGKQGKGEARVLTDSQWLERARLISQAWFPATGQGLKLRLRPVALSPQLRVARLSIGGTQWSYAHGQVTDALIEWAPDIGVPKVDMELETVDGEVRRLSFTGAWALLRWASHAHQPTVTDRSRVLLQFDGPKGHVQLLVMANTARNPLDISLYEGLCKAGHTAGKIPSAGSSPAPAVVPAEVSPVPGDTVARGTMRLDHSLSADWRSRLSTGAAAEGAGGAASAMPAAGR